MIVDIIVLVIGLFLLTFYLLGCVIIAEYTEGAGFWGVVLTMLWPAIYIYNYFRGKR